MVSVGPLRFPDLELVLESEDDSISVMVLLSHSVVETVSCLDRVGALVRDLDCVLVRVIDLVLESEAEPESVVDRDFEIEPPARLLECESVLVFESLVLNVISSV